MSKEFLGRGGGLSPFIQSKFQGVEMLEEEADIASSLEKSPQHFAGKRSQCSHSTAAIWKNWSLRVWTRMKTLMADKVESAILYHEPRIELEDVSLDESHELEGALC
ncbi:MAG: GPW/gp25 family protein [Candidatus Brocadiaceae bacterium]